MDEDQRGPDGRAASSLDLDELIGTHGDRLLRSAYLLCGDETEAQDLVQETFLQALKSAHRFQGASSVYTWLYGILRNLSHRHLRKQKRLVFEEDLVLREVSPAPASEATDRDFCAASIAQALQKLPLEHREVIVLRYYEKLKIQEIAARTCVSAGTVKSRLHYAVRRLEQLVSGELNLFAGEGTQHQATS